MNGGSDCSTASRLSGEQLFGTAKHTGVWVLLETTAAWNKTALSPPAVPADVADFLKQIDVVNGPVRCLAVRRPANRTGVRLYVAASVLSPASLFSIEVEDYAELLTLNLTSIVRGEHARARCETGHIYAVCVHGSHDRCCGTYAARTFRAATATGVGRVLLSSHIGGCRFAPNVLCLPDGLLYGHVAEDEVRSLIEHHERGQIYLKRYRGRSAYSVAAQVAEYYVRHKTGILDYADLLCTRSVETSTGQWLTTFVGQNGVMYQTTHRRLEPALKVLHKCGSTEERLQFQHECLAVSGCTL